jgi:hypothetical protein
MKSACADSLPRPLPRGARLLLPATPPSYDAACAPRANGRAPQAASGGLRPGWVQARVYPLGRFPTRWAPSPADPPPRAPVVYRPLGRRAPPPPVIHGPRPRAPAFQRRGGAATVRRPLTAAPRLLPAPAATTRAATPLSPQGEGLGVRSPPPLTLPTRPTYNGRCCPVVRQMAAGHRPRTWRSRKPLNLTP